MGAKNNDSNHAKIVSIWTRNMVGDMPRILYTFFDTYDLGGKTIAPFCTSGGSGLSETPGTIAELEAGAMVFDGLYINDSSADSAQDGVSEWLSSIGLAKCIPPGVSGQSTIRRLLFLYYWRIKESTGRSCLDMRR